MVRIYQNGDHHFIGRIYHEAIHRLACRDYSDEQLDAWAGNKGDPEKWSRDWQARCERKLPFVKILDGRVVGFIELDTDGHIDCVFVDPDHVGRGVMDEIMTEVKRQSASLGLPKLFAEVSITALKFFERQGFEWVRDNVAVIGEIELVNFIMEWKVDSEMIENRHSIIVRRAGAGDSPQIAALLTELGYPADEKFASGRLELFFDREDDAVWVAECGGEIAGFLSFHVIPLFHAAGGLGRITALSVDPRFQRQGVGGKLVAVAESFGWERGCLRIEVTSGDHRSGAHAFYESTGYRQDCRRFIKSQSVGGAPQVL